MKRTTVRIDEALLAEAVRLSGSKTGSEAVNRALADWVRRTKARRILSFGGSGLWRGSLREMRGDPATRRRQDRLPKKRARRSTPRRTSSSEQA